MTQPRVRFSVIKINHGHIYAQADMLLAAGAELVSVYAPEPELLQGFMATYPWVHLARGEAEILEDPTIHLVVTSAIPCERAPLGIRAMQHGKDFQTDKPGFTTLAQLAEVRRVHAETGRIYSISFNERFQVRAAVRAGELIRAGAIGQVVQTIGLGPHRVHPPERAAWFYQREQYGGILADIASHQFDQFLYYTGSTQAEIVAAQVGNFSHPEHPELEDFGDVVLRGNGGVGYIRVDWCTPQGLGIWGDGRSFILGTEGNIELRKYIDIAGRAQIISSWWMARGFTTWTAAATNCPMAGSWWPTSWTAARPPCRRHTVSWPPSWRYRPRRKPCALTAFQGSKLRVLSSRELPRAELVSVGPRPH